MRSTASRTIAGFSTLTRLVTSFWFSRSCMTPAAGRAPRPASEPARTASLPSPRRLFSPTSSEARIKVRGRRPISRVLCFPGGRTRPGPAAIPLGARSPARSSHLPASSAEQASTLAYLVLLRMEVAAFHPAGCYTRGLVSVALFVTSPCQGITLHPALRSPDFPPCRIYDRGTAAARPTPACNFTLRGGAYKPNSAEELDHEAAALLSPSGRRERDAHGERSPARTRRGSPHALPRQARHRPRRAARSELPHQDRSHARRRPRALFRRARRRHPRLHDRQSSAGGHAPRPRGGGDRRAHRRAAWRLDGQHGGHRGAQLAAPAIQRRARARQGTDDRRCALREGRPHPRHRRFAPPRGGRLIPGDPLPRLSLTEVALVVVEGLALVLGPAGIAEHR